jgi:hypothetical protein
VQNALDRAVFALCAQRLIRPDRKMFLVSDFGFHMRCDYAHQKYNLGGQAFAEKPRFSRKLFRSERIDSPAIRLWKVGCYRLHGCPLPCVILRAFFDLLI